MNLKARYDALIAFLLPYQDIWKNEIMLQYPNPLEAYPSAWIEELLPWIEPQKTLDLTYDQQWDQLSHELRDFHDQTQALAHFPSLAPQVPLPVRPETWVKIIPKKQHELERLTPILGEYMQQHQLDDVVDIGGGLGHLAQTLAHHYQRSVVSLDMDEKLQLAGQKWQQHKWPQSPTPVRFQTHRIDHQDATFMKLLSSNTLTTGLHTCGGLAVAQMSATNEAKASLANMGCCYHKLLPYELHLSQKSKESPLPWGLYALTLASGAHHKVSLDDVIFRNQVKFFRYTLHFLLHDHFEITEPVTLGNADPKSYLGQFSHYAREQLARLQLSFKGSDEDLNHYYQREENLALVKKMLAAALIRDQFGRVLESAIILDRALFLEENGYEVQLGEIFDPKVSPRNILLLATPR